MKLSEAIRLGAMLKPQAFGIVFNGNATCAFGAALEAIGKDLLTSRNPWLWTKEIEYLKCPECGETTNFPAKIISHHLNDNHKWTRERIAAWVATVEPQEQEERECVSSQSVSCDVCGVEKGATNHWFTINADNKAFVEIYHAGENQRGEFDLCGEACVLKKVSELIGASK